MIEREQHIPEHLKNITPCPAHCNLGCRMLCHHARSWTHMMSVQMMRRPTAAQSGCSWRSSTAATLRALPCCSASTCSACTCTRCPALAPSLRRASSMAARSRTGSRFGSCLADSKSSKSQHHLYRPVLHVSPPAASLGQLLGQEHPLQLRRAGVAFLPHDAELFRQHSLMY